MAQVSPFATPLMAPCCGPRKALVRSSVSPSMSVASRQKGSGVSSLVTRNNVSIGVPEPSVITGASFTGSMVMMTSAVSQSGGSGKPMSHTWYTSVSSPL